MAINSGGHLEIRYKIKWCCKPLEIFVWKKKY